MYILISVKAFSQKDMTTVTLINGKNKSGFLAGIMKRFRSGLQQDKNTPNTEELKV